MWNGFLKPAICGESTNQNAHTNLWSALATGIAITPLMWQFNANASVWSPTISANWPPVAAFVADINFAYLTGLAQATVTVSGATAYGIKSNEVTFGWIAGAFSGKSLSVAGVANKTYALTWFDCTAGTVISTSSVTVTNGTLTATVPTTSVADIAFKAISPTTQVVSRSAPLTINSKQVITYDHGSLRLLKPLSGCAGVTITTVAGREIARYTVTGGTISAVPIDRLESGVYCVKIMSGNAPLLQKVMVAGPK